METAMDRRARGKTITGRDAESFHPVPSDEAFEDVGLGTDFMLAASLEGIGNALIAQHAHLSALRVLPLAFLWKRHGGKSKGKGVYGKLQKTTGLLKHFGQVEFVVWLAADHLRDLMVTEYQVEALIFHELSHAGTDEDSGDPITFPHDFEGFSAELLEYGAYMDDLRDAVRVVRQLPLVERQDGFVPEDERETAAVSIDQDTVVNGVVDMLVRVARGDREGVPDGVGEAFDRLVARAEEDGITGVAVEVA